MEKFWMVLGDGSTHTQHRHSSFMLAQAEAKRLASLCQGQRFFVLGCEGFALKRDPIDWVVPVGYPHPHEDDDQIPF
jgi:hypothetical protein